MRIETVDYEKALAAQKRAVLDLQSGNGREVLFVLSHPPTITIGRRGDPKNIVASPENLRAKGIKVVKTERGGDVTFHCPGQVVAYPVFDIASRRIPPPRHVSNLEDAMVETLKHFGIVASRIKGMRGVYTGREGHFLKIGAVGVAVARGICWHGLALNVRADPDAFSVIVPCGLKDAGVTSMHLLARPSPDPEDVADVLAAAMRRIYGGGFDIIH